MKLSDYMLKGWEGRDRAVGNLLEYDADGNVIACCAIGAIALGLGIEIDPALATGDYTNLAINKIDTFLGCKVLDNYIYRTPDDPDEWEDWELDDDGRLEFYVAEGLYELSDSREPIEDMVRLLDEAESALC